MTKLSKKLKEEINFPYGRTHLFRLLKTLGFKYKKRGRESILNERSDLIMWRESFLRRIREIREKEPQREIVYTDETWLNGGHRVKKEWVDLKALENPRRSIKEYGTVGCTKDNVGKGKRIIIVDCIKGKWYSSWCSLDIFSRLEVTKRKAGNIIQGDCSYHRKSKGNRAGSRRTG